VSALKYVGSRLERILASKQYVDGQFRNTARVEPKLQGNKLPMIGEYFFGGAERVPSGPLPVYDPRPHWGGAIDTGLRATWLGHSTVLLELDGARVLTDPVFGERASPLSFAGPRRFHPTPAKITELPELDAVVLSHDHYDHMCKASIVELAKRGTPIITSLGVGARLEALGIPSELVIELDWFESAPSPSGRLRFHARPAQHFSGRGFGDRNQTLWASFVIESENRRVFFSGDSGLTPEFAETGAALGPFDLVMLEVGAYHPSWGRIHLGPENALTAHAMLGGGTLLPVHWGTFNLALHAWNDPAETLIERARQQGVHLVTPRLGVPVEPSRIELPDAWWREVAPPLVTRAVAREPSEEAI
jgi:L-ascorbate metabolism protein UlaG (beta-lactamase superfamily)